MTAFEVVLLLCGIVCVVVSFVMGDSKKDNITGDVLTSKLTEEQKSEIRRQINEIVEEEVQNASEKTEVSLDRISNTKILEMNEYAENVLGQINRNHNETVFLYDMLNDKAKEVKTTVKDVNTTKRQVERIQAEVAAIDSSMKAITASDSGMKASAEPDKTVKAERSVKAEKIEKSEKPEKAEKSEKAVRSEKPAKEKEFKMMTPDIVKEIEPPLEEQPKAPPQPAAKKTRQSKKSQAASAAAEDGTGTSGNVAKERLRRVVAKEDEAPSADKKDQKLSEEDRMDAAIIKAGGAEEKPAKPKAAPRKTAKKTQTVKPEPPKEVADMNIQFESGSNNNETILKMYKSGKTNKDIAKELNLGVGEVKLVIDLYNSTK